MNEYIPAGHELYDEDVELRKIDNEVRKLVDAIVYAVYDKNADLVDDWTETLVTYVQGLLK